MMPRSFIERIIFLISLIILFFYESEEVIIGNETMVPEIIPKSPPIIIQINTTSNNQTR